MKINSINTICYKVIRIILKKGIGFALRVGIHNKKGC